MLTWPAPANIGNVGGHLQDRTRSNLRERWGQVRALTSGRYVARLADGKADLAQAMDLRNLVFRKGQVGVQDGDTLDTDCLHILVETAQSARLVCCFRVLVLTDATAIPTSYSAQFYDLSRLAGFGGPMLELGRFCVHPAEQDPDILRLAWGVLARLVDQTAAEMLFGCSSFAGTHGPDHDAGLAVLQAAHLAPEQWQPLRRAADIYDFSKALVGPIPDLRASLAGLPPLLRSYLAMGAWVSDHAVVDRDLNTLHVFTAVEIAKIPPARARALRLIAG